MGMATYTDAERQEQLERMKAAEGTCVLGFVLIITEREAKGKMYPRLLARWPYKVKRKPFSIHVGTDPSRAKDCIVRFLRERPWAAKMLAAQLRRLLKKEDEIAIKNTQKEAVND